MSRLVNFNFNELSRINNDSAVTTQEHIMNTNAANYRLYNPYENKCMGGLDFATKQPNVFVNKSTKNKSLRYFCLKNEKEFIKIVQPFFLIKDVGFSSHKLFGREITEFIISAENSS